MADSPFTHIDERAAPRMVDVGDKALTKRVARAQAVVRFPASVAAQLRERQFASAKGPVFHTAIIAGVMAAKRTSELIPFCHPLSIERCDIEIEMQGDDAVVSCTAALTGRTGVEMEALTGATVAALTIYDMCKALSREISIVHVGLIEKRGGKSDLR